MGEAADLLVSMSTQRVKSYTRTDATGHVTHVAAYLRSPSKMSDSELQKEVTRLTGATDPQDQNRLVAINNEVAKRALNVSKKDTSISDTFDALKGIIKGLHSIAQAPDSLNPKKVIKKVALSAPALSETSVSSPSPAPASDGPAVDKLKSKAKGPTQEENQLGAVDALRKLTDPQPKPKKGGADVDDTIAKHGMTGVDPYENYDGTAAVANDLDVSWLDARDHIMSHSQDEGRAGYGRTAMAARVLQAQQGMDPTTPEYAEALLKTTQHGYYQTTPSERTQWAKKIAAEGIDPLQWIRKNLTGENSEETIKKFLEKQPKEAKK